MKRVHARSIVVGALSLTGAVVLSWSMAGTARGEEAACADGEGKIKTLLLVGGEVHDFKSIGNVVEEAMKKAGKYEVTRVDGDLDALLADRIKPYDLVVFYWTLGTISEAQKKGALDHIAGGKGFVTFHSGADSFRGDKDWHNLVGGHFVTHPPYRTYQVTVTDKDSPITKGIEDFQIKDEQYILDYDKSVRVLATAQHEGKPMPVLWTKPQGKGRVFYSALGHDGPACRQPMFLKTFLRGCLWAAGRPVVD